MRSRILTNLERKAITKYLDRDGERDVEIRSLARHARAYLTQLRKDLDLVEKFSSVYERRNGKGKAPN
jgi:hypothetical protein